MSYWVALPRARPRPAGGGPGGRLARELRRRDIAVEERRVRKGERGEIDALTGQDRVPLLVIGHEAICDSRRIVEHLRWRDDQ